MKKINCLILAALSSFAVACSDDSTVEPTPAPEPEQPEVVELPDWYYTGGELGTTHLATFNALEQPTASVENAGMYQSFKNGEALFE